MEEASLRFSYKPQAYFFSKVGSIASSGFYVMLKGMTAENPSGMTAAPPRDGEVLIVVGLDPGMANLGLGAVCEEGRELRCLGSQLVRTSSHLPASQRLTHLYASARQFFDIHRPDALAVEGQYFHQQRGVAFKVGQALGVCLLAAQQLQIPVYEYGPMQVKQTLVGSGHADKAQVAYMVRALLGLTQTPASHHVADALALALTHLSYRRIQSVSE